MAIKCWIFSEILHVPDEEKNMSIMNLATNEGQQIGKCPGNKLATIVQKKSFITYSKPDIQECPKNLLRPFFSIFRVFLFL